MKEIMNEKEIAPDGVHKVIVKDIYHNDAITTISVELIGGKNDGYLCRFHLDRINKSKMAFDTIVTIGLCGGIKDFCFPFLELIGIKIFITIKNKKIKKISCLKDNKNKKIK